MGIISFILCLAFTATSFSDQDPEYEYNLTMLPGSKVIIHGSTNVNKFDCGYVGEIIVPVANARGRKSGNSLMIKNGDFVMRVGNFDCDNSIMTREFFYTLKGDEHPKINMSLLQLVYPSEEAMMGGETDLKTHMRVNAAGVNREYLVKTHRSFDAERNAVVFEGKFNVMIEDFDIVPPVRAFGMVKVQSKLVIEYKFVFSTERRMIY